MRPRWRSILPLGLVLLTAARAPAAAGEYPPVPPHATNDFYESVVGADVDNAFENSDFAWLDKTGRQYLQSRSRSPIGEWDLQHFYRAFVVQPTGNYAADDHRMDLLEAKALAWAHAYPDAPAAHIAYALELMNHGDVCQCEGTRNAPSAQSLAASRAYFEKATDYLLSVRGVASRDPGWYAVLTWTLASAGRDYRKVLAEGMARFPDYWELYYAAASLDTPGWGGSPDDLDALVDRAVANTRATEHAAAYARIYGHIGRQAYAGGLELFAVTPAKWDRMAAAYRDYASAHPDPWVYSEFFFYACLAGDKASAQLAFDHIGKGPMRADVWRIPGEYGVCTAWLHGEGPPSGSPLRALSEAQARADGFAPTVGGSF